MAIILVFEFISNCFIIKSNGPKIKSLCKFLIAQFNNFKIVLFSFSYWRQLFWLLQELLFEVESLGPHHEKILELSSTVLVFLRECSAHSADALSTRLENLSQTYERSVIFLFKLTLLACLCRLLTPKSMYHKLCKY